MRWQKARVPTHAGGEGAVATEDTGAAVCSGVSTDVPLQVYSAGDGARAQCTHRISSFSRCPSCSIHFPMSAALSKVNPDPSTPHRACEPAVRNPPLPLSPHGSAPIRGANPQQGATLACCDTHASSREAGMAQEAGGFCGAPRSQVLREMGSVTFGALIVEVSACPCVGVPTSAVLLRTSVPVNVEKNH